MHSLKVLFLVGCLITGMASLANADVIYLKDGSILYGRLVSKSDTEIEFNQRFESERTCLLYTSPSPRDRTRSRMPSSA